MENTELKKTGLKSLLLARQGGGKPQPFRMSDQDFVRTSTLGPGESLPLVVQPAVDGVDLSSWVARNRDQVESLLLRHGGILFRGFGLASGDEFERFSESVSTELLEYRERSSPRHLVSGRIYTSTDYPPEYPIFLHNENSYQQTWPLKLFFFCLTAPLTGGATPIADTRRVLARLSPKVRERFAEKGWMYTRNFGDGYGLPWQTVFQTTDKSAVEEYCRKAGIELQWREGDRLRTRAVRAAITRHPRTGEAVWFNHATFFHITTLEPAIREVLLAEFAEENLPTNTYYGDGSRIEDSVLDELREAYRQETVSFPWKRGDVLVLDNMLAAHGRAPFTGPRKILVGMAEPLSWNGLNSL
jgi:alpha-ketoglutarate-dependent taurine dioxygenase